MRASPISLQDITFLKVQLETNKNFKEQQGPYDFNATRCRYSIRHGKGKGENEWWVGFDFEVLEGEKKSPPYTLEVIAMGLFSISEKIKEDRREELIFENGAALVYGAIREMVTNLSYRFPMGRLMLPTLSFVGEFNKKKEQEEKDSQE